MPFVPIDTLVPETDHEWLHLRLFFFAPLLGGWPSSSIAAAYVRSQQAKALARDLVHAGMSVMKAQEEAERIVAEDTDHLPEDDTPGFTVFHRNKDGYPVLKAYQIKAWFADRAVNVLKLTRDRKGSKGGDKVFWREGELKRQVVVIPHDLLLYRGGPSHMNSAWDTDDRTPVTEPDEALDRPVRTNRHGIEQTAINTSELIRPPCWVEFTFGWPKASGLDRKTVLEVFRLGEYYGLGQWRSADYGLFIAYVLEE